MGMFGGIKSLAYHQNGEDDPYITIKEVCSVCISLYPTLANKSTQLCRVKMKRRRMNFKS